MVNNGACYLVFEQIDGGTVSYVYSQDGDPAGLTYLAKASGGKPIPNWKFKGNGKTKLKNNCTTAKQFFVAWCTWLKEMKRNGDTITMNRKAKQGVPAETQVYKHIQSGNKIIKCADTFDLSDADAIACVPVACQDFNSPTMDINLFIETGNKTQAYATLNVSDK
ncbi:hypothetical protein GNI_041950 [Gregarina niphandrodes]|uniref:Immune mapped protein 2 N-terminal domain-containing protein n=1 Tax=Gregarina niphandrodes TaxID=110365 RepID=A0A023BA34_GRENI|nr:hypothetical protein GNI_041950 [Gregarina niphandrodes]EZG77553.1 hypothetical protein GNI_041950 [Gregarina niphandrodes]|eukprot:XP_011129498.1 hypothetical protein GNI_041950 [Gregarina niphandrodes]